jgi:hypothetical protein
MAVVINEGRLLSQAAKKLSGYYRCVTILFHKTVTRASLIAS